ncbi:hypothetical protein [Haloarchaeobius sp. HRN-SO-5]|uniref:hypothetical protein n=1 Tax=Haloarchaeobius sp. HRN-SO-5 TaxID=3446118 RepID=UPI003EBC2190
MLTGIHERRVAIRRGHRRLLDADRRPGRDTRGELRLDDEPVGSSVHRRANDADRRVTAMNGYPIRREALLLAAMKAGVGTRRLPELVALVQADLGLRLEEYRTRYECVHETSEVSVFLVEGGHWGTIAGRLGFDAGDSRAVEQAHVEHLLRLGQTVGRFEEFVAALDIRDCVVIGKDTPCSTVTDRGVGECGSGE